MASPGTGTAELDSVTSMTAESEIPRSIDMSVEVVGTASDVWTAVATGPGISAWYVPHVVEEYAGGVATASFGSGPEMQVPGRVALWDPPRRILFDGGEGVGGLTFDWLVEPGANGTCVVRLINGGFGEGGPWDDQYADMVGGWKLFMTNLQMHLEHFMGQQASSMLPMTMLPGGRESVWRELLGDLGTDENVAVGDRVVVIANEAQPLAGTVVKSDMGRLSMLLDSPCAGTALIAAEGGSDHVSVSIWSYLYGADRAEMVATYEPQWQQWLAARA